VPAETHAILTSTLRMNPNWQLFIGPDVNEHIVNPFFFKANLNSLCGDDYKTSERVFYELIKLLNHLKTINPNLISVKYQDPENPAIQLSKDLIYASKARASFLIDLAASKAANAIKF
jgi:hypothetical protein